MGGWLYKHENITNSVEVGAGAELGKIPYQKETNYRNYERNFSKRQDWVQHLKDVDY